MKWLIELYEASFDLRDEGVETLVVGIPSALEEGVDEFDGWCLLDLMRYSRVESSCTGSGAGLDRGRERGMYSSFWIR